MKISTALVCDQIRQEDNGKFLLIGVYSGSIVVNTFPATFPLALMLQVSLSAGVEQHFKLRLSIGETVLGDLEANVHQDDPSENIEWLPINLPQLNVSGPGKLIAEHEMPDGTWNQILSIAIRAAPPPPPAD